MSETLASPTNRAEKEEIDRGENVIAQLIGSTITAFGATSDGEILLVARKGDQRLEFVVGLDPDDPSGVCIFEVETE